MTSTESPRKRLPRRQAAARSLAGTKALLAAIVDSSDDAIIGKSLDGTIVSWNAAAVRMYGYRPEEVIGRPVSILIPSERRDEMERLLEAIRGGERVDHFETERLAKDGRRLQVSLTVSPIRDRQGRVVGASKIARDIGERQRAQDELRRKNEELQAANEELQVAHEELQIAYEELQVAEEAKDRFLATLSHELRTPLTPVLAVTSGLEKDPRLPADARESLSMVRRNVELEARLIDDLLDLTRISRGKFELHPEAADARRILEHALETSSRQIAEKGLRLVTDLAAGDHRVWADSSRLTQVFWNLLTNAVKFTPAGGRVHVRSWTEEDAGRGGWLAVEIADNGIGIEREVLPRIFDAFEQGEHGITRRYGGLGLGLAVSRAIVELHGGHISAASAGPGQGAAFTIRLPLREQAAPTLDTAPVAGAGSTAAGTAAAERALHVLLVEDHADTAAAMADLLRTAGHRVTVVGTVAAALAAATAAANSEAAGAFDFVVSDLGLPDGSGHDLMRELSGRYGLRGIALSGYGMEEDVRRSREAGFIRHLTKPVSPQLLRAALREAGGVKSE